MLKPKSSFGRDPNFFGNSLLQLHNDMKAYPNKLTWTKGFVIKFILRPKILQLNSEIISISNQRLHYGYAANTWKTNAVTTHPLYTRESRSAVSPIARRGGHGKWWPLFDDPHLIFTLNFIGNNTLHTRDINISGTCLFLCNWNNMMTYLTICIPIYVSLP